MSQGSNEGNRKKNLDCSYNLISKKIGNIIKKSSFFKSEGWNMEQKSPHFYNRVLYMETIDSPFILLEKIFKIEGYIGKINNKNNKKKSYRNRKIDIDILFYDNIIMNSPSLIIPHPMLHLRKFVLIPMIEIDSNMEHPIFHKNMIEILGVCSDPLNIIKLKFE
ncbi:2-amino-4-hydroxy-6-hydroxymethyldihydropteridine diphosphokinase [Blattabacterium cuenoti]|uniref:2-amino-4-hydroxy-6- hydroxymethyldihydropteridine diphosphokinase n=1 Tax=Blattabacterium cuenoti TaxID=1653831 RepID=UPI001CC22724|nr:2-amino-4-hydroxy-6-hydroxymethyldihydropteridine diphosphokinase [Blattabacterium cuenoti]